MHGDLSPYSIGVSEVKWILHIALKIWTDLKKGQSRTNKCCKAYYKDSERHLVYSLNLGFKER